MLTIIRIGRGLELCVATHDSKPGRTRWWIVPIDCGEEWVSWLASGCSAEC